jgi:beta-glucosidase
MNLIIKKINFFIVCLILFCCCAKQNEPDINRETAEIVSKMTLEEKVGQMIQITIDSVLADNTDEFDMEKLREAIVNHHLGSIINVARGNAPTKEWWNNAIARIQQIAMEETRLGIPVIYGIDQIHGSTYVAGGTLFPHGIALAATWNPDLAKKAGNITAYETRAAGLTWNFSPVLDLGADPRFPRQYEGFGEDPYLCSVFGKELIKAYEGEDNNIKNPYKVAACMKHFLGYSVPVSGKDRTPAYIPDHALYEYHLPAFQAAIDAGAHTIMINSGIINSKPVHANYNLLTKLLREEMGFDGVIVTDWDDVKNLYSRDKLAESQKEAVKLAINAGIDMIMEPYCYKDRCKHLMELVREKAIAMSRIDDAVTRIIKLKLQLGLFDTPFSNAKDYPQFASEDFASASYEAASEAITLLKNDNDILPLQKGVKILVSGPNAISRRALNGGWTVSWQGDKLEDYPDRCKTILEAIKEHFGTENVSYIPGVSYSSAIEYNTEYKDRFEEAVSAANRADYVLLCLGENSYAEKPGDLEDLYLNELQTELVNEILKAGKKTIVVLSEGRPRIISKFSDKVDAIVQTYLPGVYGADALACILAGKVNPSGKLPYTYPAYPNSLVPYYHKYADEPRQSEGNIYEGYYNPEYHFGHGLSYTTFEYRNPTINKTELPKDSKEEIIISVDVSNSGKTAGKEVVQLYSSDWYASLIPDVKRLRRFEKVFLLPGETKTVTFRLHLDGLAFYNDECKRIIEPGGFDFLIAASSKDIKEKITFKITN